MQELHLTTRSVHDHHVIAVTGEVDITTAPLLRAELIQAARVPSSGLIVDLAAVTFMDARGLGVLVGALRRARHLDHGLRLAAPSGQVAKLLRITGLDRHLAVYATVEAATAAPEAPHPAA